MDSQRLDLDLHRLELRFASSRLVEPHTVARIAHSIERCGQVVPCIVVAASDSAGGEPLVLIDGYRRVAALRRLGRDTASVRSAESKPGQRELTVRAPVSAATDRSVTIDFQRPPG
jgi:ParB family chromosome partitioning protein